MLASSLPGFVKKSDAANGASLASSSSSSLFAGSPSSSVITALSPQQIRLMTAKSKYPVFLDFSAPRFNLISDEFLVRMADVVQEYVIQTLRHTPINQSIYQSIYLSHTCLCPCMHARMYVLSCRLDLSNNSLKELIAHTNLHRLQRLDASHNEIELTSFTLMHSLRFCNLSFNRLTFLSDLQHLKRLRYLDLSHNLISAGFDALAHLHNLLTLDLSFNRIWFPTVTDVRSIRFEWLSFDLSCIELSCID